MTNEWGPPLTGEEMKALKGRIDPDTQVSWVGVKRYRDYRFNDPWPYHLPANHPYYKVREYNQKHRANLVLHDGSAKVPEDYAGGLVLYLEGDVNPDGGSYHLNWTEIIAYAPKPKESELTLPDDSGLKAQVNDLSKSPSVTNAVKLHFMGSEVTEEMPRDEAIEYLIDVFDLDGSGCTIEELREDARAVGIARLIQQYEPDRLKPAVDVAAEEYAVATGFVKGTKSYRDKFEGFKAGAAWQKENG